ncbi:hypothetical protein [Profundibacter amoris]|uniref:hypothetical protein n=1 Tax=Profundibacter amoris TaxID=2171755 RepID=UPI0013C2CEE6|nr:hypothetical protein [Profundibacter amoris]
MNKFFSLTLLFFLLLSSQSVFAACTLPAGGESQTRYDFTAHKMYYCDNTNWIESGGSGGGASAAMFSIRKANGVNGGSLPISGLNYRVLNTSVHNTIAGASLSAGTVTLPAGVYLMTYNTQAYGQPTKTQAFIDINGSVYNASSPIMTWSTYNRGGTLIVSATYSSAVPFTVDVGIHYEGVQGSDTVTGLSSSISGTVEYFDTLSVARLGDV